MKRKGQYLAVESVLTFGLGILVAIGTVTAFSSYRDQVLDRAKDKQVDVVESRVLQAVHTLADTESGHMTVELPEKVGSQDYTVALDEDGLKVLLANGQTYLTELEQFPDEDFKGSAEGGSVKVFKRGNEFTLRAD